MKSIVFILLLLLAKTGRAHGPDLSNLMIYEQSGNCFLVIKNSLTAFEGEIDYLFGKNAYKNPEEFQQLVIKHLQNNCLIIMNGDTVRLNNPKILLGHETTVFATLLNTPKMYTSIYVKNTLFKDMPANMSEVILTLNGLPQKQYILDKGNKHEVKLIAENKNWTVVKPAGSTSETSLVIWGVVLLLSVSVIVITATRKKKKISQNVFEAAV